MDIQALDKALENQENASIMQTSHSEIKKKKNDILQKLQLKGTVLKTMHATLIGYKYIDDIDDLMVGRYVRWISLKRPDHISLTNGAHVCNINIQEYDDADDDDDDDDDDGDQDCKTCIRCKVVRNGKPLFFNLNFDENLVFQKITEQEWIILDALAALEKMK
ncbi:MAG: hypothetical protein EBY22_14625 [Gammaproteobacteria bacterium]|nr:hypothetical protein [Gammaproteobacteria bacterium]